MDTYDFASKRLYRARRESAIDRMCVKPVALRRVAYLDTAEALDTISYLKRGYRPEHLWAINRSPAEVANLTMKLRRLGLPTVQTVGLDFEDALTRRVPDMDVIDFDGMGCLTHDLLAMLQRIVTRRQSAVYGVTLLGGRESKKAVTGETAWATKVQQIDALTPVHTSFGSQPAQTHGNRVRAVVYQLSKGKPTSPHECVVHVTRLVWDVYVSSSKQPMVWMAMNIEPHREVSSREADRCFADTKQFAMPWCHLVPRLQKQQEQREQRKAARIAEGRTQFALEQLIPVTIQGRVGERVRVRLHGSVSGRDIQAGTRGTIIEVSSSGFVRIQTDEGRTLGWLPVNAVAPLTTPETLAPF